MMKNSPEELMHRVEKLGILMFSDTGKIHRPSSGSNSYIFSDHNRQYVLDPGFGDKRCEEISAALDAGGNFDVLCTHYHNDHSANNGRIANRDSRIYYHHAIKNKIRYLRTNGTGQVVAMGKQLDLPGMLKRFRMFPDWLIAMVVFSSRISGRFPALFLFIVSYLYSRQTIGRIDPGRKKAAYLALEDCETIALEGMEIRGWRISANLIAIDTPGHTDDHLAYYLTNRKILFAGDALNFLNGNDIQYGDIPRVHDTIRLLLEFVIREKVSVLLQGHYYPVIGSENIAAYVNDILEKHMEIYKITCSVINAAGGPLFFDELFERLCTHPAELPGKLARITFPRSTLVFLDVYLLKILRLLGYAKQKSGEWVKV